MTTRELLLDAKAVLQEGGWWQGSMGPYFSADTPHCVLGAIECAEVRTNGGMRYDAAVDEAIDALKDATGACSLIAWNDAPDRTEAEVLAALDKAIETIR